MSIDLIKRIEAAEGPGGELDEEIAFALGIVIEKRAKNMGWVYANGCTNGLAVYTSSIDAAMTLVPEGWGYQIMPSFCVLRHPESSYYNTSKDVEAYGKTPALALCAAALKARSK